MLNFGRNRQFSEVVLALCIPTTNVRECLLIHIFANTILQICFKYSHSNIWIIVSSAFIGFLYYLITLTFSSFIILIYFVIYYAYLLLTLLIILIWCYISFCNEMSVQIISPLCICLFFIIELSVVYIFWI